MNTTRKDVPETDSESHLSSLQGSHAARRAMDYYLKPIISESVEPERLFEVRRSISSEEAMIHASDPLRCAAATAYEAANHLRGTHRDLTFSVVHMIDLAKALVDRCVEGSKEE